MINFLKKNEFKKIIFLSIIFLMLSFNHTLLRSLKDIIFLEDNGASTIYYLKLFFVPPFLLVFAIVYSKISLSISKENRFNIIMIYFIVIFSIFAFLIFPNSNFLRLKALSSFLIKKYPKFINLWKIIENWPNALFYINSEAWGAFALTIAFWTIANDIFTIKESKKFYSILSISSNLGSILSGLCLSTLFKKSYTYSLNIVILLILLILITFKYFSFLFKNKLRVVEISKTAKINLSLKESIQQIFKSKYVLYIALLVFSYGVGISLLEAIWKDYLSIYANGSKAILAYFYGKQMIYIGIISICLSVFLFPAILKKGWIFKAYFTPILFLIVTVIFFVVCSFGNNIKYITNVLKISPMTFIVSLGLVNIVFVKASKYSFFDTSKEAAYIPLDEETKTRSKAAIDGVGTSFGKGVGASIISFFSLFSSYGIWEIKYILGVFIFFILIVWIFSVNRLYSRLRILMK